MAVNPKYLSRYQPTADERLYQPEHYLMQIKQVLNSDYPAEDLKQAVLQLVEMVEFEINELKDHC
ncbi:hypothetical protein [Thermoflavimicrobium dichotomicum]|uniref:Uncharacterized protein n=1 Tax=Thermoflavimicrobium dichotomicum TaxID=46223 RepID=A0A1I3UI18_9BACL|nr:hypothetical protein [Thermoflavimicrobium dichotomicum]SFJ82700.1 hypothetical protein SAMN05421852_12518 [Thermoflavimicrobium dichotomicum]